MNQIQGILKALPRIGVSTCVTEVIQEESSRVTESSSGDNRRIARELKSSEGEDDPKANMKRND